LTSFLRKIKIFEAVVKNMKWKVPNVVSALSDDMTQIKMMVLKASLMRSMGFLGGPVTLGIAR
jgi:hypothetical protein